MLKVEKNIGTNLVPRCRYNFDLIDACVIKSIKLGIGKIVRSIVCVKYVAASPIRAVILEGFICTGFH